MNMKWVWVIILVIVGALATFVAVEYLTTSIHNLPSYIPGRHPGRGHYRKRGAGAALVAFLAFVGAGYLAYRAMKSDASGPGQPSTPASTGTAID